MDVLRIVILLSPLLVVWYAYIVYAFFRYRFLRQEELANVLAAAADSGAPLAPALWAYLRDRPRDEWRTFWMALLLFFMLPGYYFYWRRHNYETKVEQLASMLENGFPLPEALRAARGVASREIALAAAVGASTGKLGPSLRLAPRWRLAPVWMESAPRLLYPVFLVVVIYLILSFLMVFMIPKYEKIFADFKLKLPPMTDFLIMCARWFTRYAAPFLLLVVPVGILAVMSLFSATVRWYFPGLGRLQRMHTQSRVLRMLSVLLEAGKPLPQALDVLADSGYFRGTALYRLARAQQRLQQGEPLAASLYRVGLLPRSLVPLVDAAERARNLPWALGELGESLARRAVRFSERLCLAIFPLTIIAAGALVGCVAFGMFTPLISLLAQVGQ
jgi:type II secretory pathway component PulF